MSTFVIVYILLGSFSLAIDDVAVSEGVYTRVMRSAIYNTETTI
jgi:hypothetical protein